MPGGSRNRTPSWWDDSAVAGAAIGTSGTVRGVQFIPQVEGRVYGLRYYSTTNDSWQRWGILQDAEGTDDLLQARPFEPVDGSQSARWRNLWFHPAVRVTPLEKYKAWIMHPFGRYHRLASRLDGSLPQTVNGLFFEVGIVQSSFNLKAGTTTADFHWYAVDVLFMPDDYTPLAYP